MHTYAYLGPAGTFTEAALQKITASDDVRNPYINVTAALDAVRAGEADYALVPIRIRSKVSLHVRSTSWQQVHLLLLQLKSR